eukprot:GHUV01057540.1.p1 GENE.GHUV01057540.1~~GHUV01057540.1.p1  ORF type:complete len:174 (+),score=42.42 GHUV01057540.1:51-524(+)
MALAMRQISIEKLTYSRSVPVVTSSRRLAVRVSAALPLNAAVTSVELETASAVHTLSSESYRTFIASNELVLVDYYTDWCGPCKIIAPHLEVMAQEMPAIKFAKLNCTTVANAKKIAMSQGIKALPTFHLFRGGEKVGVFVGGKPQQLKKFLLENTA